jgi:hypothetical protein
LLVCWLPGAVTAQKADMDSSGKANPDIQGQAPRDFRTFLPKPGEVADDPATQIVQLLLDRQDKNDYESYMIQVLFRGKPARERNCRILEDRIVIDFYDTGKPAMRLAKIRGGALEASALEELYYRDVRTPGGSKAGSHAKKMVRLILFIHGKPELKFRDTLDRTLIHFRLPNPA